MVDNNETACQILRSDLERFAWEVTTATSGQEAIQLVELTRTPGIKPYDLVLMDWKMPGMDGIEAATYIKYQLNLSHPPAIILVTAYGREEVLRQAQEARLDGFLVKPISASLLLDAVMEAFGKQVERRQHKEMQRTQYPAGFEAVRGARLLLVEDNEINRQVATELLEQEGFWVSSANDGRAAFELVRDSAASAFDLVLMDLQMPEMDGYVATQEIRKTGNQSLPIIAMSADAMSGVAERCFEAGMNDYVTKPIDPQELFTALVRWIPPGTRTRRQAIPDALDTEPALPVLPGIDIVDGLARVGGNRVTYHKLLLKFAHNNANTMTEIRAALQQDDMERAVRLAHTLKGVAGNIGANTLYQVARELETAFKEQGAAPVAFLDNCDRVLQQVVQGIAALEPAPASTPILPETATSLDVATLTPLVARLRALLQEDDMEAVAAVAALQAQVKGTGLEQPLRAIEAALSQYDFQQALGLLGQLALSAV